MLLFGVILMLLMIFLCAKYRKNGFIKIIAFYFFAISFNILVGTVYLSKSVQPAIEFKMDTQIFSLLYSLRIPYSTIIRMFNISILVYMLVSVIYIKYISKCGIKCTICMIIPSLYVYITSDPSFSYRMFILSTSDT